jgi:hypothetical protein
MNDKKQDLYTVFWTQDYPNWQETIDEVSELMLEYSDMKEANELINRIKGM